MTPIYWLFTIHIDKFKYSNSGNLIVAKESMPLVLKSTNEYNCVSECGSPAQSPETQWTRPAQCRLHAE